MSDLVLSPNFMNASAEASSVADAEVVVLPVAYDRTSSWHKGADLGPQAMLNASAVLELHDSALDVDLSSRQIATLPVLTTTLGPEVLAGVVEREVGGVLERGALPVVLGGEHSVSIGAIRAAAAADDTTCLTVIQIDCHTDTRERYFGSTHSHACVMARAREVAEVVHVGIRSLDAAERRAIEPARLLLAEDVNADESGAIERVAALAGERAYVTIDLDGLSPELTPATGTPQPPGLSWSFVTGLLARLASSTRVVGFDVVELCPRVGQHAGDVAAARLVQHAMALVLRSREPGMTG